MRSVANNILLLTIVYVTALMASQNIIIHSTTLSRLGYSTSAVSQFIGFPYLTGFIAGFIFPCLIKFLSCSWILIIFNTIQAMSAFDQSIEIDSMTIIFWRGISGFTYTFIVTEITIQLQVCDNEQSPESALETAKLIFMSSTIGEFGQASGSVYVSVLEAMGVGSQAGQLIISVLFIVQVLLVIFFYSENKQKEKNSFIEMGNINPITMQTIGLQRTLQNNQNNFDKINETSKENIVSKEFDHNSKLIERHENIKAVEKISIFKVMNMRVLLNCILTFIQTSQQIQILQFIEPYLISPPYNLTIVNASLLLTCGTISVVLNAVILYISHYTQFFKFVEKAEKKEMSLMFSNKNNPTIQMSLGDIQRQKNTLGQNHLQEPMNSFLPQDGQNMSIAMGGQDFNVGTLNCSIYEYLDFMIDEKNHNNDKNISKDNKEPKSAKALKEEKKIENELKEAKKHLVLNNMKQIILGGYFYAFSYQLLNPSWISDDMEVQLSFLVIAMLLTCLGQCNTFIHMAQEFNFAILSQYENQINTENIKQESSLVIEQGTNLQNQLWQIGCCICPVLISLAIDQQGISISFFSIGTINFIFCTLYLLEQYKIKNS